MSKEKSHLKKLWPYVEEYKGRITLSLILIAIARVMAVADPYVIKKLIDALVDGGASVSLTLIGGLVALFFALRFGSTALDSIREYLFARVEYGMKKMISLDIFKHILDLPVSFHSDQATGGLTKKISRGISGIQTFIFFFAGNILPTLIELTFIMIVLGKSFPPIFMVVFSVFAVVYISYTVILSNKRQKILLESNEEDDESSSRYVDALMNYETVKYFNNSEYEYGRYNFSLTKWIKASIRSEKIDVALNFGQGVIIALGLTALLGLATREFIAGSATVGDFVLLTSYLNQIARPMSFLGFLYRRIKQALADTDAMFKLFDIKSTINDKADAKELKNGDGHVELKDVFFSYDDKRKALDGVSIDIPAHKRVALVGYSGSGKSTVSKLLLRFYDVNEGGVYIDGQNIKDVTQNSLRERIGVVAQDTVLFNESIFYNIEYGKPGASMEEVEKVAKMANVHDFITNQLPDGYDTQVGQRGVKLSGGEKQRIAIARMLLKNPEILLFDEATASLDSQSEKVIQEAIESVSKEGKTTIVIAHRLSTIVDFDKIVVMENGKVVEEGTHQELIGSCGVYQKLWDIQKGE